MSNYCWHNDLRDTGTCQTCSTAVTVERSYTSTITLPGAGSAVSVSTPEKPTVREAIATMLGIGPSLITIEDILPGERYATSVTVTWGLAGSKVKVTSAIEGYDRVEKTPNYSDMAEAAEA